MSSSSTSTTPLLVRVMARCGLVLLAAWLLAATYFVLWVIVPFQQHRGFCDRVEARVHALLRRRPPELTPGQWENVVVWTLQAHGNTFKFFPELPLAERARFESELEARLAGKVDLATIDWIWDEIVRLTPGGRQYSENWRPTRPDRLAEFPARAGSWGYEVP